MRKFLILTGLLASVLLCGPAHAERRVALVVGNAHYANTQALRNPVNDAREIATVLKKLGFDVIVATDVDQAAFARQIDQFGRQLEGADVGLFYYGGHGLQVNDKNYLVSTNARLESEFMVPSETIELNAVIHLMESRAPINLVFLDACRNNPLADNLRRRVISERRAVALGRGLAKIDPTGRDTLIAFSAAPGQEASDGEGQNSPFTQALLKHMPEPGVEVSLMLKLVSADVREATRNGQRPQQLSDMAQAFYFAKLEAPKPAVPVAQLPPADRTIELAFWQSALAANDCDSIRSYLTRFPNGSFIELARLTEKRLCTPRAAPAPAPGGRVIATLPATTPAPPTAAPAPAPSPPAEGKVIAALPPADAAPPPAAPPSAEIARDLQKELIRVGCGPSLKASGEWDAASRAALTLFNRHGKAKFTGPSADAVAAVHQHNDRVCPLVCGRGMKADGETCVAVPAKPAPPPKKERQATRPRPVREDSSPPRRRAGTGGPGDPNFAPEGGQQRGTRANNAIAVSPITSGGRQCHTLDIQGLAPRIVCP